MGHENLARSTTDSEPLNFSFESSVQVPNGFPLFLTHTLLRPIECHPVEIEFLRFNGRGSKTERILNPKSIYIKRDEIKEEIEGKKYEAITFGLRFGGLNSQFLRI